MIRYGKVTEIKGYKNGKTVDAVRRIEESHTIESRQELFDHILEQLGKIKHYDEIQFTVMADRETHQPVRLTVVTQEKL